MPGGVPQLTWCDVMEAEPISNKGCGQENASKVPTRKTNFSQYFFLKRKKQKHLKFNLYQKAFFIYFFNLVNFIQ